MCGSRRYGRSEVIQDAATLLMKQFDLDAAQAVAALVQVSKQQNDSMEAAARLLVGAGSSRHGDVGAPEPVRDQPRHRRVRAQRIGHRIRTAVA
jgi:hypothetical protein